MAKIYFIFFCVLMFFEFAIGEELQITKSFFTKDSIIPDISDAYGVVFRDINNDDLPDIYLVCFRGINRLLINNGSGNAFGDATIVSGLGGNLMPMKINNLELGSTAADFDNDGDREVIIAGWGNSTSYFRNEGDLRFSIHNRKLNIEDAIDFNDVITGDVNNDGYLDLFFTDEHHTNRLLLNINGQEFKDVTVESGLEYNGICQGAGFCDLDRDGDLDLYVTNWKEPDLPYRNTGNGRFIKTNLNIEVCIKKGNSNSVSFGDVNNDGTFDLFITNREGRNYLFANYTQPGDSNWIFKDITIESNLTDSSISYGSVIADFNNDGWQDIFVTNIGPNQFYLNTGSGKFEKIYQEPTPKIYQKKGYSTGAACADYDQDGDLDLFIANKDTFCVFYKNTTNNKSFIKFKIRGVTSNSDAIGTVVEIFQKGKLGDYNYLLGTDQISGGSGYLSTNEQIVHFGLDTIQLVDARFFYPSGIIVKQYDLKSGTIYEIFEHSFFVTQTLLFFKNIQHLVKRPFFVADLLLILSLIGLTFIFIRLGLRRYLWSPVTASSYLAGFFAVILISIGVMLPFGFLETLIIVNSLVAFFLIVFVAYSENIRKLQRTRDKYRKVLIELSNEIVNIHNNDELSEIIVTNTIENTLFSNCCIVIIDSKTKHIENIAVKGLTLNHSEVPDIISDIIFHDLLTRNKYLYKNDYEKTEKIFNRFKAQHIFPISHNSDLYGFFTLGTDDKTKPLSKNDIALYSSLTNQLAVTLENNEYIRRSNEMVKKLTEAEVREKYLIELEKTNSKLDEKNHELQKLYDELKNTQSQLIHSEKMSSLGQLVAGISHELNNPIGFIYSNSNQLKKYIQQIESFLSEPTDEKQINEILPDLKSLIDDTISGSNLVKELVDNLRQFSHLDQAKSKMVDLHKGIDSSLRILNSQLKNRIKVHKNYGTDCLVECNPGQINQVFLNLLSNAAQAIEKEGNIWIDTKEKNDYFVLEIKDDGKGIRQENLTKIFDPFFTTKDVGEGTGLGLSISYSIIKNHKGTIKAESKVGQGSTFTIELPIKKELH